MIDRDERSLLTRMEPDRDFQRIVMATACTALVLASGCGLGTKKASISGTVKHAGNPVAVGRVWFEDGVRGRVESAAIAEGTFRVPQLVEPAVYHAYVTPEKERPSDNDLWRFKPAPDIPEKYRSAATSELVFTIIPGKNELTIELD